MSGKATPLSATFGKKDLGTFHAEKFNLMEDEGLAAYAKLRNRANDASEGVTIEMMREYTRKTTTREGEGDKATIITTDDVFLLVKYWVKSSTRQKGETDAEIQETTPIWSQESEAS